MKVCVIVLRWCLGVTPGSEAEGQGKSFNPGRAFILSLSPFTIPFIIPFTIKELNDTFSLDEVCNGSHYQKHQIINRSDEVPVLLEIKSSQNTDERHTKNLILFQKYFPNVVFMYAFPKFHNLKKFKKFGYCFGKKPYQ